MMATLAEVNALRTVLGDITSVVDRDLLGLVQAAVDMPPAQRHQTVFDAMFWEIVGPAAGQFDAVSGTFYLEDRANLGVRGQPPRQPALTVDAKRVHALVGWGLTALAYAPEITEAFHRISGGSQRLLFDRQRDGVLEMAGQEHHEVRYQRMAAPGCCAFCAMLASRGAVYTEQSVTRVVGRGVPLGRDATGNRIGASTGRSGRTGKGLVTRGARPRGEEYHDFCRCVGVAVHEGREQQMNAAAAKWLDIYTDAFHSTRGKLEQGSETWLEVVEYTVAGKSVIRNEPRSRSFWVDDRKGTAGYGDELAYDAFQKQLLQDMRAIASEDYDLVLR